MSNGVKFFIMKKLKNHLVIVKMTSFWSSYYLILQNYRLKFLYLFSGALYDKYKVKNILIHR
jgi:hypothetical protein